MYLIAHKVRGEPAFDIAEQMECPECHGDEEFSCDECDNGVWWIISTFGHRAHPYWTCSLETLGYVMRPDGSVPNLIFPMPPGIPDLFPANKSPSAPNPLAALLAGLKKQSAPKVTRRI